MLFTKNTEERFSVLKLLDVDVIQISSETPKNGKVRFEPKDYNDQSDEIISGQRLKRWKLCLCFVQKSFSKFVSSNSDLGNISLKIFPENIFENSHL